MQRFVSAPMRLPGPLRHLAGPPRRLSAHRAAPPPAGRAAAPKTALAPTAPRPPPAKLRPAKPTPATYAAPAAQGPPAAQATPAADDAAGAVFAAYEEIHELGGHAHPTQLIETSALAAIPKAPFDRIPFDGLPPRGLSNAQLEAIALASAAHEDAEAFRIFGTRRGFFLADGTGCGKGRSVAGCILLSMSEGRRKNVWVSFSEDLLEDARRDLFDVAGEVDLKSQASWKAADVMDHDSVLFSTYSMLRSKGRLAQLLNWCGGDFEGVLVLDEVHYAALDSKGPVQTKTALAVDALQQSLPKARVLYVSATGAHDVDHLGQFSRLHLWGGDQEFSDSAALTEQTKSASRDGQAELLAIELKLRGLYCARQLSLEGLEVCTLDVKMDGAQRNLYDAAAVLWLSILEIVVELKALNSVHKYRMLHFWAVHQTFFMQLILTFKVRTTAAEIRCALARGCAVVVGLQSTGGNAARAFAKRRAEYDEETPAEASPAEASSCHEALVKFLDKLRADVNDLPSDLGATTRAQSLRDRLDAMELDAERLELPQAALPLLIAELGGAHVVAELTGRSRSERQASERADAKTGDDAVSAASVNLEEMAAFKEGRKFVAVISAAGSTGISLHADPAFPNHLPRVHFTFELPWSAAPIIQQLGRSHRAGQASAPKCVLVVSDVPGEQRKAASAMMRLAQVGALRGDRRAALGSIVFGDCADLGTAQGGAALKSLSSHVLGGAHAGFNDGERSLRDWAAELEMFADPEKPANPLRYYNRCLGASLPVQDHLAALLIIELEREGERRRKVGISEHVGGVRTVPGAALPVRFAAVLAAGAGSQSGVMLHVVDMDHSVDWSAAVKKLATARFTFESAKAGPNGGKHPYSPALYVRRPSQVDAAMQCVPLPKSADDVRLFRNHVLSWQGPVMRPLKVPRRICLVAKCTWGKEDQAGTLVDVARIALLFPNSQVLAWRSKKAAFDMIYIRVDDDVRGEFRPENDRGDDDDVRADDDVRGDGKAADACAADADASFAAAQIEALRRRERLYLRGLPPLETLWTDDAHCEDWRQRGIERICLLTGRLLNHWRTISPMLDLNAETDLSCDIANDGDGARHRQRIAPPPGVSIVRVPLSKEECLLGLEIPKQNAMRILEKLGHPAAET
ncbi:P-loop containing NTP hydrolase pore-1-domain-containing protein [Pelagophyceae sp. CCMP2097]|nr:P-loop containing NTP hydrolase pore-1-domain-containing protein [Pelagophyceae sp. CCMP2097]